MNDLFLILSSPDFFFFSIILFAFLGAIIGSFTSALIHRARLGVSWIGELKGGAARSACPKCNHVLSMKDLVPIISWCFQKGRCRYCSEKISKQYVMLEALAIVISLALFFVLGASKVTLLCLVVLPFILAQFILFFQSRIISAQFCAIIAFLAVLGLFLLT